MNPNCGRGALEYIGNTAADIVCMQETESYEGIPCKTLERDAKVKGWALAAVPCGTGEKGGPFADVAVVARSHLGMAHVPNVTFGEELKHTFNVKWTGCVMRGRLFVASVYLYNTEQLSSRNIRLLEEVAKVLLSLLGPWILGDGFPDGAWEVGEMWLCEARKRDSGGSN